MNLESTLDQVFLGVSVGSWLLMVVVALVVAVGWRLLRGPLSQSTDEKTEQAISEIKHRAQEQRRITREIRRVLTGSTLSLTVFALAVGIGVKLLDFPAEVEYWSLRIVFVLLMFQAGTWGDALLKYSFDRPANRRLAGGIKILCRSFMWLLVVLVTLENLNVDISTAVAGLGITGVAVAIATQRILGDILAFLSITYDRPFEVGDFLIIGDDKGTVEEVTLRSTRLRTLTGEALIISNSDLLSTRIRNYETLGERGVIVTIGVVRDTQHAKLAEIPGIVTSVISELEGAKLDRVHLRDITESAFDFEIMYYVLTPDFKTYMNIRQTINLEVVRRFEERGIRLALPIHQIRTLPDSSEGTSVPEQDI